MRKGLWKLQSVVVTEILGKVVKIRELCVIESRIDFKISELLNCLQYTSLEEKLLKLNLHDKDLQTGNMWHTSSSKTDDIDIVVHTRSSLVIYNIVLEIILLNMPQTALTYTPCVHRLIEFATVN